MSQGDHRAQPKRNGVLGHSLVTQTCRDEQTFNTWKILLCTGQVLTKGSDRAEQQFVQITTNKGVKGQHRELLEARVRNRRILGLSYKVRKKGEGTQSPTVRVTNMKEKAVQLTTLLATNMYIYLLPLLVKIVRFYTQ